MKMFLDLLNTKVNLWMRLNETEKMINLFFIEEYKSIFERSREIDKILEFYKDGGDDKKYN